MNKKQVDKNVLTTQVITDNVLGSFLKYMPNPDSIALGTTSSYETYRKMKTDARIKSLLNKLKNAALNFPFHITQPEGCPDHIFTFIKEIDLWKKLHQKMKRVYSSLDYGFSVSELVWKIENGLYVPDNIITRKPERFKFDYDWNLYLNQQGQQQLLNHEYKWLIYNHDTDDENPYGTSVLRCVYWAWMFKQAGYEFWLQATEKFSVKTILALFKTEGDENKIRNTAQLIAEQLINIVSGSAAAVGNVDSIHEIGMSGELIGFASLVDACDVQISYGLTGQSVATSSAKGGSLALGEVQSDLFYEDAKSIALEGQIIIQKIINWTIELNFGKDIISPIAEIDTERKASFEQVMNAIDHGIEISRDALYNSYGLPKPRNEDDAFIKNTQESLMLSDSDKKKLQINERFFLI